MLPRHLSSTVTHRGELGLAHKRPVHVCSNALHMCIRSLMQSE